MPIDNISDVGKLSDAFNEVASERPDKTKTVDTNDNPRFEPDHARRPDLAPGGHVGTADAHDAIDPDIAEQKRATELEGRARAFEEMRNKLRDPDHKRTHNLLRDDFDRVR